MRDESTKQAAQEYLATRLTEEQQRYEDEQNRATAIARSTARRLKLWSLNDGRRRQMRKMHAFRMRGTSIEIDEKLICKARKLTRLRAKREIVDKR